MISKKSASQFEIKTICRLMSNCGRLRIILFTPNSNEFLDFEMQRTNSSFQDFPVWTQIIWTFDIKLADISANESSFFCVCVFCFVEFDLGETKWPFFFFRSLRSKQFVV